MNSCERKPRLAATGSLGNIAVTKLNQSPVSDAARPSGTLGWATNVPRPLMRSISPAVLLVSDGRVAGYVRGPEDQDPSPREPTSFGVALWRRLFGRK